MLGWTNPKTIKSKLFRKGSKKKVLSSDKKQISLDIFFAAFSFHLNQTFAPHSQHPVRRAAYHVLLPKDFFHLSQKWFRSGFKAVAKVAYFRYQGFG
jgi:hypothetical protein